MVAPYTLFLLSVSVGTAILQLPVLPPLGFVQVFVVLAAIVVVVSVRSRRWRHTRRRDLRHECRRVSQAPEALASTSGFALLAAGTLIMCVSALLAVISARHWQERQLPVACERQELQVEGVIQGLIHSRGAAGHRRYRFDVQVLRVSPSGCSGPRRIRVYSEGLVGRPHLPSSAALSSEQLLPGSKVGFKARLRRPWGLVNPAAGDGEKSFLIADVHGVGSASQLQLLDNPSGRTVSVGSRLNRLRDSISRDIQDQVPGETGALLAALAVGDRRGMSPQVWDRLRVYGVSHLLVISGMHITLLSLPGWYLGVGLKRIMAVVLPLWGQGRVLPPACAMITAGGYALLSGLALPAQRAVLMLILLLLPGLWGRALPTGRVLPVAGTALFVLSPVSTLSASFWLTLGAVAMLLWYAAWRGARGGLRASVGAQTFMLLAMLPWSLFWFGEASSMGGLVNLIAIPLITLVVVPLVLGSVAFAHIEDALAEISLTVAASIMSLLWSAMAYWEPVLLQWSVLKNSPDILMLVVVLTGVLLLPAPASLSKSLIVCLLVSPLVLPSNRSAPDAVEVVFFDVGQGTAVLIRHGGKALLYDTGGGAPGGTPIASRSVLPILRAQGIDALDTLIISHPDLDHDAGEELLVQRVPPHRLRRGIAEQRSQECRLGESHRLGETIGVRYLSQRSVGDSDNNSSCILLVSAFGRRVLLAGDINSRRERDLLAYWGRELKTDILLAGHHGSASSNSRLWLRSLDPKVMVVTAGHSNRFGHPANRVVDAALAQGIKVLNTATHGAVVFRIYPDGAVQCEASRNRGEPFWRRGAFPRDCMPPHSPIRRYNQRHR